MKAVLNTDVILCGAGAAGLALGVELARRDVSFRLVEEMAVPFVGSRGKGIQPRSQEIYEDLGIIDRLVARGGLDPPSRHYAADGSFGEQRPELRSSVHEPPTDTSGRLPTPYTCPTSMPISAIS